jgi:hypothetical protein
MAFTQWDNFSDALWFGNNRVFLFTDFPRIPERNAKFILKIKWQKFLKIN